MGALAGVDIAELVALVIAGSGGRLMTGSGDLVIAESAGHATKGLEGGATAQLSVASVRDSFLPCSCD